MIFSMFSDAWALEGALLSNGDQVHFPFDCLECGWTFRGT